MRPVKSSPSIMIAPIMEDASDSSFSPLKEQRCMNDNCELSSTGLLGLFYERHLRSKYSLMQMSRGHPQIDC